MASCPHNVDEWVHCPAARLSLPSAIQVGNWVLIECNLREEKQHKQMKTQKIRHQLHIQQIQHLSANSCQHPSQGILWPNQMTSLLTFLQANFTPPLFLSMLPSVLSDSPVLILSFYHLAITLLHILLPHPFLFQFSCLKCAFVTWYSRPQLFILSSSSHFCMQVTIAVGEAAQQYRTEQKK